MRLSILHESSGAVDWSFLKDVFDEKEQSQIITALNEITKGFKFDRQELKENNGVTKGNFLYFNNALIELQLTINANKSEDKNGALQKYMMINIEAKVQDRYLIPTDNQNHNTLVRVMEFVNANNSTKLQNVANTFQKTVNDFVEWYFDISGQYGKVKLLGTTYNVIDGYSRGGEYRFIAIAGDFHCETDLSKDQSDMRVY